MGGLRRRQRIRAARRALESAMPKTTVNGLEMYYEFGEHGIPVVLISGLTQDHLAWVFQVPALTEAGYRCLVFDNRDAGQTTESPRGYAIRQFADDTVELMDAVGIGPAHVVGASMGGMIAQEIAIAYPSRVASLTLVCTAAEIDPVLKPLLEAWKAQRPHCAVDAFALSVAPWLFTYRFLQDPHAVRQFVQMVRDNPFPQTPGGFVRQCDAIMTHNTVDRLSRITVPTHVIVGVEDCLTPPHHSRRLAERIPGATLTEVPAAGHLLMVEKAEVFNRLVIDFLAAQRTAVA
jgi:3-oxoadipate enol-lactonase